MTTRIAFAILAAVLSCSSCTNPQPKPDSFYQVVVTCTTENTSNAAAGAAVMGCLTGAVSGDYTACLAGLLTAGHWTVDEIACIVRAYATTSAQRLNAGTPTAEDTVILRNANDWIRANQIGFR
jgi:hypothetical protein